MRETIVIPLSKPLRAHGGESIKRIVLREPTFDEYLSLGDPWTIAASNDGAPFAVENTAVIKQYIDLCILEPKDTLLLNQASARVARQVKEKLLAFFRPDATADEVSGTSGTSSPSPASGETASTT
jgi:hypothetical protein